LQLCHPLIPGSKVKSLALFQLIPDKQRTDFAAAAEEFLLLKGKNGDWKNA
jgi:hypothetical protein